VKTSFVKLSRKAIFQTCVASPFPRQMQSLKKVTW